MTITRQLATSDVTTMGKTKQLGAVSGETVLHTNDLIYRPARAEVHGCVCVDVV